jgi:YVTN family beta-propeller protein
LNDDTVSVVDRDTYEKITDIKVGDEPYALALYQDDSGTDKYVYVGNVADNTISIIDIGSLSVVATYQ